MSRDQNAGRSHSVKTDDGSFERAEELKYLGTSLTSQNSVKEEIKTVLFFSDWSHIIPEIA